MKCITILFLLVALAGCETVVPVQRNFPKIPEELSVNCGDLNEVPEDTTKLSDTLKVIVGNYGKYHECRVRMDAWIKWYKDQRIIFESIK
jgi:hypothetical protein